LPSAKACDDPFRVEQEKVRGPDGGIDELSIFLLDIRNSPFKIRELNIVSGWPGIATRNILVPPRCMGRR
jgi:hypothetical protein